MGHREYRASGFDSPGNQHNIIAFVGNGFDVQALSDYGSAVDTRYVSFYHFLKLRSFDEGNPILQEMEKLREEGKEDWSDVEGVVADLLARDPWRATDLSQALRDMQGEFSEFLSLAVPSDLLTALGSDSMDRSLAVGSLSGFLGDLEPEVYRRMGFPGRVQNFDVYNFLFVNFNYTPLLDDFVYLDQKQFDPLPYRTVDRNFVFKGNPSEVANAHVRPGDTFSSYVMTDVVHPHGHQSIPRSLLFGIDEPVRTAGNQDRGLRLAKPFWAQNERRYKHLFADTELYIIFGCSLGESDRWWWRHIAESLGRERSTDDERFEYRPELIIYWFNGGSSVLTQGEVREKFFSAAGLDDPSDAAESVHVVLYDDSTERAWLNTSRAAT
ncbi:AbiH family protein [Pseudactinotalea sp. HY158]|uniref:AbiH family protein n=1 Tax=Pseudactinotalea sp. HY158 TaxID=2654547 RepID=UPI00129C18F7|nr:AbiH family protein [Pseudactinotalea sp. HY158]QGH69910.1 hypothetical protein GCE65_10635 [Pseudactinotalea sp. HY158]